MKYEAHQCQRCGAYIGYVGRGIQNAIGCRMVAGCHGSEFDRALMNTPTKRWWVALMLVWMLVTVTLIGIFT